MTRRKGKAPPADTVNPRPDPGPSQPADRIGPRLPDRPVDVTMPEAIPPRKDRNGPNERG